MPADPLHAHYAGLQVYVYIVCVCVCMCVWVDTQIQK